MKLYFAPEHISMAPHIILIEAGFDFTLIRVNVKTLETSSGENFLNIQPRGYVPALVLDNEKILTETPAMLQYLADLKPRLRLVPRAEEWLRVQMWEAFDYLGQELHALCIPFFMPEIADEIRVHLVKRLLKRLDYIEHYLENKTYFMGDQFTIVDAYAYSILATMPRFSVDLLQWRNISAYMQRLDARESITKALEQEMMFAAV